jgi:two-component system OmpR family response regulator
MRVLVVEDEPDVAQALAWGLNAEGYTVDVADNGVDGLWKATQHPHDVIILDVMLPGMDGYQVCRGLRERGIWTPILMLTALDDDLDHAEGLDSGADDYLPKPFSYPILLAHLRSLTRRVLGARPSVLTAAGLALDPSARTVTRNGVLLELTTREVAVLEHCWDINYDGDPAVVQVLMHRLRRKIEAPDEGGGPVIETVRGQGYVIRQGP